MLTSDDDRAVRAGDVTSTESVGGEVEGSKCLAGDVIHGSNLSQTVAHLQSMYSQW